MSRQSLLAALAILAAPPLASAGLFSRPGASKTKPPEIQRVSAPGGPAAAIPPVAQAPDETPRAPAPEPALQLHLDLAQAHASNGRDEAAVSEYRAAIEAGTRLRRTRAIASKLASAHRQAGGALDRLGRFDEAQVHHRAALELAPSDAKVWNDAGYSDYLQGRWSDAERKLLQAAKLNPKDARVQTNLGLTLAASGRSDAALAAFTRGGDPAVGHANLAYVLAASGQAEAARGHYRTALQLRPDLAAAREALARLDAPEGGSRLVRTAAELPARR